MIKTENPFSSKTHNFNEHMIDTTRALGQQPEGGIAKDVNLQDDLKPLWVACYFDRRLTKNQI